MSVQFDLSRYEEVKYLGRGAFGIVHLYKCLDCSEHSYIAVKKSQVKTAYLTENEKCQFQKEIKILSERGSHPNIVRYLGHRDEEYLSIILEYMPGGSIEDRLKKIRAFTEITARRYTRDVLKGLEYLHSRLIIHSDIKGANILLSSDDTAKLADLDVAKVLRTCTKTSGGDSMAGTCRYMAPEVVKSGGEGEPFFGRKSDIWSVGCVVVEMLTNHPPWQSCTNDEDYEICVKGSLDENNQATKNFIAEVPPDKEWHDRLLHILSNMLAEEDFKELKHRFHYTDLVSLEGNDTIGNSFLLFVRLESDKLISVGQYDALMKHLETMKIEECIRVIREHNEKIEEYQKQTRQAKQGDLSKTKVRYVAPPSADVNKCDKEGETPLMRAAENNDVARVRSLIEAGADLDMDSDDYFARTALVIASEKGHTEVVAELIKAGANTDIQNADGFTALILAAQFGHKEVVAKLIESRADVNIRNVGGYTALSWAAAEGHKEIVAKLIEAGADVNIRNELGRTALRFAMGRGHREIAEMLKSADTSE